MSKILSFILAFTIAFAPIFLVRCGDPAVASGGAEIGNPTNVTGSILHGGSPASNIQVQLIPSNYNPILKISLSDQKVLTDTTNEMGFYLFEDVDSGSYNIFALDSVNKMAGFLPDLIVENGQLIEGTNLLLSNTNLLSGVLVDSLIRNYTLTFTHVYVPGTPLYDSVISNTFEINGVPPGNYDLWVSYKLVSGPPPCSPPGPCPEPETTNKIDYLVNVKIPGDTNVNLDTIFTGF